MPENKILQEYVNILLKWQSSMNLISNNDIDNIYSRHVGDSLQLVDFLASDKILDICDLGSGGGFPAIVLAAVTKHNIDLVESNTKKVAFLNHVIDSLGLKNAKVYKVRAQQHNKIYDVVTSRAMAPLSELVIYSKQLLRRGGFGLFLKGESVSDEIKTLHSGDIEKIQVFESKTHSKSKIIKFLKES